MRPVSPALCADAGGAAAGPASVVACAATAEASDKAAMKAAKVFIVRILSISMFRSKWDIPYHNIYRHVKR